MIRRGAAEDGDKIIEIWKAANIQANDFIDSGFWIGIAEIVKDNFFPISDIYVYESDGEIRGFISIVDSTFLSGLFVAIDMQNKQIGSSLLNFVMERYPLLELAVYDKNIRGVEFFLSKGFKVIKSQTDTNTGEIEHILEWKR